MNSDICVNHAQSDANIKRHIIDNTSSSSKDIQYLHCTLFPFAVGEQLEFQCFCTIIQCTFGVLVFN